MPTVSKKPASCLKKPSCKKPGVKKPGAKVMPAASLDQALKNVAKKPSMEEVKDDDEITLVMGEQSGAEDGQPPSQPLMPVQPAMDGDGGSENTDSQSPVTDQPVGSPPLELPSSSYYHDVASADSV